uniref:Homeobox domain-containing protein n=1 Tax=Aegilops tauschii subsp. strangulata TaxID=200361 RepID=A0A453I6E4_AEGTS
PPLLLSISTTPQQRHEGARLVVPLNCCLSSSLSLSLTSSIDPSTKPPRNLLPSSHLARASVINQRVLPPAYPTIRLIHGGGQQQPGRAVVGRQPGGERRSSGGRGAGEPVRSRWTPKPEQILILESIFNSGMVNPPKDETVRIRKLLERFGAVGDANVFYWFQNRRSRS